MVEEDWAALIFSRSLAFGHMDNFFQFWRTQTKGLEFRHVTNSFLLSLLLGFLFLQEFNCNSLQLTEVLLYTSSVALNGIKSAMCEGFLILDITTFENVCWKKEY